ncbi:MAG: hypothetical protein IH594_12660 [Bacteroidales bacterium]|nr:hypothetical protein [Bacteroidales bacterium]
MSNLTKGIPDLKACSKRYPLDTDFGLYPRSTLPSFSGKSERPGVWQNIYL